MDHVLRFSFKDKPDCKRCMVSHDESEGARFCCGIGSRPRCPEEGSRNDCPLEKVFLVNETAIDLVILDLKAGHPALVKGEELPIILQKIGALCAVKYQNDGLYLIAQD